ncbi:MAG: hypothetical protein ABI690_02365 [Chloroflexota bacterium]
MTNLHRWQLDSTSPFSLHIAADARLSQTDYADDQIWELLLGSGESPALALQTHYGGRAGLASIVPMWFHEGRMIYQAQAYAKPPSVTAFAPGYLRTQATLNLQLALQAEYWVIESHVVGARYTIANAHTAPVDLRLDMLGFVGSGGKEQKVSLVTTADGKNALSLGLVGNIFPIILLEDGVPEADAAPGSTKIGKSVTIPGRKKVVFRWVHAGLGDVNKSLALAQKYLQQDWDAAFKKIETASQAIPIIETGNRDWDITIATAYQQVVQAFLKPTASLPNASFVAVRDSTRGFSPRGGSDHDRAWSGQNPTQAYLTAQAIASIDPTLAEGIIRNYLAVQQADGWIDWKPGLGGQQQGVLCMPILARLAWGIFLYTEDAAFLSEVFPGLLKFFERWFKPDLDGDGDGLPEWQSENQTGYVFMPTFASWQSWGQGTDIRLVETPDLAAYLLSEAKSLHEIAYYLRDTASQQRLDEHINSLQTTLETLWDATEKRYTYRERDTHTSTNAVKIIEDARGTDDLIPAFKLSPANRLIVRVTGGMDTAPQFTMRLAGSNHREQAINDEVPSEQFVWSHGRGVYTSRSIFSQIDKITFEGLSRVYRVDVHTIDTTRRDMNALLPLWSVGIAQERADELIKTVQDTAFWRPTGVTMCAADDPNFDPSNADGSGGVWPYWLTLIGEGLIENGASSAAYDLLKRLLTAQTNVLKDKKSFSEFYHSDEAIGLGESGHISGIVPLHLLMRLLGTRIISHAKVWIGGPFVWENPVIIQQHGVTVSRNSTGTHVEFPSGYATDVSGELWQEIRDPNPLQPPTPPPAPIDFTDLEPELD